MTDQVLNQSLKPEKPASTLELVEGIKSIGSNVLKVTRIGASMGKDVEVDDILESFLAKNPSVKVDGMTVTRMGGGSVASTLLVTYSMVSKT